MRELRLLRPKDSLAMTVCGETAMTVGGGLAMAAGKFAEEYAGGIRR